MQIDKIGCKRTNYRIRGKSQAKDEWRMMILTTLDEPNQPVSKGMVSPIKTSNFDRRVYHWGHVTTINCGISEVNWWHFISTKSWQRKSLTLHLDKVFTATVTNHRSYYIKVFKTCFFCHILLTFLQILHHQSWKRIMQ